MRRPRIVLLALAVGAAILALVALGLGDYPLNPLQVIRAAFGPDQGIATTIVVDWRLPRVVVALGFGAALGVSGALFQSLTKNPLGSPDIIGFSTGSYTGALIVLTVIGQSVVGTTFGALAGGLATALLVYLLASRRGVQGFRLIIVGIGVTAVLNAVNTYLLLRASTEVALGASIWGAGSISLVAWPQAWPALAGLAVMVPVTMLLSRPLRQLELGDDVARAHGLRVEPARLGILVVGVALMALVTATSGPIAFVALAAPQVARRLTRSAGIPLTASALVGGVLLLGADTVAQHAFPSPLPVGLVTVVVGGAYLLILLVREAREAL
jgi:iron complex transport system permease protein